MKKVVMSQTKIIEVGKLLERSCRGENGGAVYEEGFDDARIAQEAGVTILNVSHLRKALYGNLRAAGKPIGLDALQVRLKALEDWARARPVAPFKGEMK